MATCPAGHASEKTDWCDECGLPIGRPPPRAAACPACGEGRPSPQDRFCEGCGHDMRTAAPPAPPPVAGWTALVWADRAWFDEVRTRWGADGADSGAGADGGAGGAGGLPEFPAHCPERRFDMAAPRLVIGRRSRSRGTNPDIDLTGPPLDPGVSAMHALLQRRPDGGWELVDLGSMNGTLLGDATEPIPPHRPVPLRAGDRIRLGVWTTITVCSR